MSATDVLEPKQSQSIISGLEKIDFDTFGNDAEARRQALDAARRLARRLETPMDSMWEMTYNHPLMYACAKVALDTGVYEKLDEDNGSPKTTSQLANPDFSVDPNLLKRILRHLAAMYVVRELDTDLWGWTRLSRSLRDPKIFATIDYMADVTVPAFMGLPKFLEKTGYKDPNGTIGNWQFFTGSNKSHFDWMEEHPEAFKTFSNLMSGYASQRGSWLEVYPTSSLLQTAHSDGMLMVDVGGGQGQDMMKFLDRHPEAKNRLVVEDLSAVIDSAEQSNNSGIEFISHNFFAPQPIKSARVYYMHSVLHDWPDEEAQKILQNLKPAMQKGYSRLLVNELVIKDFQAGRHQSSFDLTMMSLLSARERTEKAWISLLESAGYKVMKVWQSAASLDSIIEAEV